MHAVSLYQPYPTLIACGAKRLITTSYSAKPQPGEEIAIHATKTPMEEAYSSAFVEAYLRDARIETFTRAALSGYTVAYGAVVAIAAIAAVVPVEGFDFPEHERPLGRDARIEWVWLFDAVRAIRPIPAWGMQGLWVWEPPSELDYLRLPPVRF